MTGGGPDPRQGDVALSSVLDVHNLAMSGGLLDAVQRSTYEQLDAAQTGYRWLRLRTSRGRGRNGSTGGGRGRLGDDTGRRPWSCEPTTSTGGRYPQIKPS